MSRILKKKKKNALISIFANLLCVLCFSFPFPHTSLVSSFFYLLPLCSCTRMTKPSRVSTLCPVAPTIVVQDAFPPIFKILSRVYSVLTFIFLIVRWRCRVQVLHLKGYFLSLMYWDRIIESFFRLKLSKQRSPWKYVLYTTLVMSFTIFYSNIINYSMQLVRHECTSKLLKKKFTKLYRRNNIVFVCEYFICI